ncbi:MAG: hypothetical protein WCL27_16820, partial [Betaproteobacteria bacterium]
GVWAMLAGMLSACATGGEGRLHQNLGDLIIPRLQLGMTHSEVDVAIGDLRKYVISDDRMIINSERMLFGFYSADYYPKDVLKTVEVGTAYRVLGYRTSGSGAGSICLFFDDRTKRLRGWANTPSSQSKDKFMHERLTSRLTLSDEYRKRMNRDQVRALIGMPNSVIVAPKRLSKIWLEDHFWISDRSVPPSEEDTNQIDVYEYELNGGLKRHVYVAYTRAGGTLKAFGYDHAWEEAERYLREKKSPK